jgi:hypothetical protein
MESTAEEDRRLWRRLVCRDYNVYNLYGIKTLNIPGAFYSKDKERF